MNRNIVWMMAVVVAAGLLVTTCGDIERDTLTLTNGKTVIVEGGLNATERSILQNALDGVSSTEAQNVLYRGIIIVIESRHDNFHVYSKTRLGIKRAYISDAGFATNLTGALEKMDKTNGWWF